MGDSANSLEMSKSGSKSSTISENKVPKRGSVTSRHIVSICRGKNGSDVVGDVALFFLKVAALETARRFSKAKCPSLWRGIQALQVLSYPPFKWVQRFAPFKGLIRCVEMFSRPLLVLSIATAFTEETESNGVASNSSGEPDLASSDVNSEIESVLDTVETRVCEDRPQSSGSEIWLIQLHKELEELGIALPERINENELRRFYAASNGEYSSFLRAIKKTIRWRETYRILSVEELDMWSNLVYWHGFDVKQRPCLIVRLGLACVSLPSSDRPRFAQAVISNVEHGVLQLLDEETPEITVLVDCEGLSPFRIPMQIARACSSILQDNFPNRLGCLFVIRLPPVLRVIAQTFIQMLKPVTRRKLKVEGEMFRKVLSEYLEVLPSYLDGKCTCEKCSVMSNRAQSPRENESIRRSEPTDNGNEGEDQLSPYSGYETDVADLSSNCDQVLRTAVISVLMLYVFIAVISGLYDSETRPFFPST